MSKVAVVYWSSTGNTEAMAQMVKAGIEGAGAEVDMFTADEFDAAFIDIYDAFAYGCPAMGDEVLEEEEFQPLWDDIKGTMGDKKVVLFGSYGWGTGEWMDSWNEDAAAAGVNVVETVIANYEPDDEAEEACKAAGAKLA